MARLTSHLARRKALARLLVLALITSFALIPASAGADSSGGSFAAYLAYRQSANTQTVWAPLFRTDFEGWNSSLAVHNETNGAVRVEVRARTIEAGTLTTNSFNLPSLGTRVVTGAELGLRAGFNGSLTVTADGEISAVSIHDGSNFDRMTVLSPESAVADSFIPLAFNNYNGWRSIVSIQNTNRDANTSAELTFNVEGKASVVRNITLPSDSARIIDFTGLENGPMSIEIDAPTGATIVASAYHIHTDGSTSVNLSQSTGGNRVFIPLLWRKAGADNAYDSGVQVVNVTEGAFEPSITFIDRDTGDRIGPISAGTAVREGQSFTWYLPSITSLADNKVYSAEVEVLGGSTNGLVAIANHVNYIRRTAAVYPGAVRGDSSLSAPLVYKNVDGFNSGIQIQNLTGGETSALVRFRSTGGSTVEAASRSYTVPARGSVTIYLPAVAGLPETFVGAAEITTSGGNIAAVANTVRYR
jgi:hypothetical protein